MAKPQMQSLIAEKTKPVGDRLKVLRQERGLTLNDVAERTAVSISNLSKIERGEVSPSFDVVMKICKGLGIALEQFVQPGPKIGVSGRKTVTLRGKGVAFESDQYRYQAHSIEIFRKNMVPLEMWIGARSPDAFDKWSQHDGEEFVYVIDGAIEVHTDQYAPFELAAGESAYFDSSMRHIYVSVGTGDAHILSISYSPHASQSAPIEGFMNPAARAGRSGREAVVEPLPTVSGPGAGAPTAKRKSKPKPKP